MKILHILDHSIPLQSGYTFRTRNILRHQREIGWETCHVTSSKHIGDASEEDVDGLHFYRTPAVPSWKNRVPGLGQLNVVDSLAARLEDVIEREKPDVLHAHSPALNGLAMLKANRRFKLPTVYECRAFWEDAAVDHGTSREWGPRYRLTRALESRVFRQVDAVTTICDGLRQDIVARGIAEEKIGVIPNAVDVAHFDFKRPADEALRERLGLKGKHVIGFIGSFYAYEGLTDLVQALSELVLFDVNVRLLLVGGGPEESKVADLVSDLNLGKYVVMTGRVPHNTVQDYYGLVDVLVYPRQKMRLTELVTPLKPLEAMAQGKLVMASDVGGHRELIEQGKNGFLFRADDVDNLVVELGMLFRQRESWPRIQQNGRQFVESVRNWKNSVAMYRETYERLLA